MIGLTIYPAQAWTRHSRPSSETSFQHLQNDSFHSDTSTEAAFLVVLQICKVGTKSNFGPTTSHAKSATWRLPQLCETSYINHHKSRLHGCVLKLDPAIMIQKMHPVGKMQLKTFGPDFKAHPTLATS